MRHSLEAISSVRVAGVLILARLSESNRKNTFLIVIIRGSFFLRYKKRGFFLGSLFTFITFDKP